MASNKTWVITAVSSAGAALAFNRQGTPLFAADAETAAVSPVEHLLAAAAGCLALSCRAVLTQRGRAVSLEVTATGNKAGGPPSRLERIALAVRFAGELNAAAAASIVAEAEKLCTVTNTLRGAPKIEIE